MFRMRGSLQNVLKRVKSHFVKKNNILKAKTKFVNGFVLQNEVVASDNTGDGITIDIDGDAKVTEDGEAIQSGENDESGTEGESSDEVEGGNEEVVEESANEEDLNVAKVDVPALKSLIEELREELAGCRERGDDVCAIYPEALEEAIGSLQDFEKDTEEPTLIVPEGENSQSEEEFLAADDEGPITESSSDEEWEGEGEHDEGHDHADEHEHDEGKEHEHGDEHGDDYDHEEYSDVTNNEFEYEDDHSFAGSETGEDFDYGEDEVEWSESDYDPNDAYTVDDEDYFTPESGDEDHSYYSDSEEEEGDHEGSHTAHDEDYEGDHEDYEGDHEDYEGDHEDYEGDHEEAHDHSTYSHEEEMDSMGNFLDNPEDMDYGEETEEDIVGNPDEDHSKMETTEEMMREDSEYDEEYAEEDALRKEEEENIAASEDGDEVVEETMSPEDTANHEVNRDHVDATKDVLPGAVKVSNATMAKLFLIFGGIDVSGEDLPDWSSDPEKTKTDFEALVSANEKFKEKKENFDLDLQFLSAVSQNLNESGKTFPEFYDQTVSMDQVKEEATDDNAQGELVAYESFFNESKDKTKNLSDLIASEFASIESTLEEIENSSGEESDSEKLELVKSVYPALKNKLATIRQNMDELEYQFSELKYFSELWDEAYGSAGEAEDTRRRRRRRKFRVRRSKRKYKLI